MASCNLTGVWFGSFTYPDGSRPVNFMANIDELDGTLGGRIDEPNTFLPISARRLISALSGRHDEGRVVFEKVYRSYSPSLEPIRYRGWLNLAGDTISGRWTIPGHWSGGFTMSRPVIAAEDIELEIREPV